MEREGTGRTGRASAHGPLASRRVLAALLGYALLVPRVASAEPYSVSFRSSPANLTIYERTGETTERAPLERQVVVSVRDYRPLCSPTQCTVPLSLGAHTLGVGLPGERITEVPDSVRIDGPTNVDVKVADRSGRRTAGWVLLGLGMGTGLAVFVDGMSHGVSHGTGDSEAVVGALVMGLSLVALGLVFQWDEVQVVATPMLIGTPKGKETDAAYPAGVGALILF